MEVLHVTGEMTTYEVVKLIANNVSKTNNLTVIEKGGKVLMTGGHILTDTPQNRKIIESLEGVGLYNRLTEFRNDPFVKKYYEE